MIIKTQGIVLHHIKFIGNSNIVTIYTENSGRVAYLVRNVHKKNSVLKSSMFQPLTILDLEVEHKPKRELQIIKEAKLNEPLTRIGSNIYKSSIVFFIAEVLLKTLREEESNSQMFMFIKTSALLLDKIESGIANFHLIFMLYLCKYIGFFPENNHSEIYQYFDLTKGYFTESQPNHSHFADKNTSEIFSSLMKTSYNQIEDIRLNHLQRNSLSELLINFFRLHLDKFGEIKSLNVLKEIFKE